MTNCWGLPLADLVVNPVVCAAICPLFKNKPLTFCWFVEDDRYYDASIGLFRILLS